MTENSLDLGRLEPSFDYEMSVRVTVSYMRDATSPSTPRMTFRAFTFQKMRKTVRGKIYDQISRTDRLYSFFFRDERWNVKESQRKMNFGFLFKRLTIRSLLDFYTDSDFWEYN